jgi:hypothetical protein
MSYRYCQQLAGPAARGRSGAARTAPAKGRQDAAARRGRLLRRLGFLQSFLPYEWWSLGQTQLCALINKLQSYCRGSALITTILRSIFFDYKVTSFDFKPTNKLRLQASKLRLHYAQGKY